MDRVDRKDRLRIGKKALINSTMVMVLLGTLLLPLSAARGQTECGGLSATIVGTANSDVLRGTEGNDVIVGRGGDDLIYGNGGNDVICGNGGHDTIHGGAGNDTIYGGTGRDLIYGNEGDDSLNGQGGKDTIDGGSGVNACDGESVVNCGSNPVAQIDTTPPSVAITSPSSGATISGTTTISATASDDVGVSTLEFYLDGILIGSDTTNEYSLSLNTVTLYNGAHTLYTAAYDAAGNVGTSSVIEAHVNNTVNPSPTVSITCQGLQATIIGTPGNDALYGTEGNDIINGLGGNDGILGYGGDDIICGGDGDDHIIGYGGDDIIYGESGLDSLYGSSGNDTLYGGDGSDRLVGNVGYDALYGDDGVDFLDGGSEEDVCIGEYSSQCP
jgi:Ca2+-binding RTX toxin-like protein